MKPIERLVLSFLGDQKISLYLSPFSPLFLWKSIGAKLWEGRLRPITTLVQRRNQIGSLLPVPDPLIGSDHAKH